MATIKAEPHSDMEMPVMAILDDNDDSEANEEDLKNEVPVKMIKIEQDSDDEDIAPVDLRSEAEQVPRFLTVFKTEPEIDEDVHDEEGETISSSPLHIKEEKYYPETSIGVEKTEDLDRYEHSVKDEATTSASRNDPLALTFPLKKHKSAADGRGFETGVVTSSSVPVEDVNDYLEVTIQDEDAATDKTEVNLAAKSSTNQEEDPPVAMNFHIEKHGDQATAYVNKPPYFPPESEKNMRPGPERKHPCSVCGKAFTIPSKLKTHMYTHTGERFHSCEVCNKAFLHRSGLKTHMRTHTGERPHACEVCKKSFTYLNYLKRHMRSHTGERPYLCDVCKKSFGSNSVLRKHMRIHTHETPHACEVCNRAFGCKSSLRRHMCTHTNERPHACSVCGKSFISRNDLTCHMYTHTGERPHSCDVCKKSFTRLKRLKAHQLQHLAEKPYLCVICKKSFSDKHNFTTHTCTAELPKELASSDTTVEDMSLCT